MIGGGGVQHNETEMRKGEPEQRAWCYYVSFQRKTKSSTLQNNASSYHHSGRATEQAPNPHLFTAQTPDRRADPIVFALGSFQVRM